MKNICKKDYKLNKYILEELKNDKSDDFAYEVTLMNRQDDASDSNATELYKKYSNVECCIKAGREFCEATNFDNLNICDYIWWKEEFIMYNEKIFETSGNWELLNAQIWEDNFDYEFFKDIAKDTFEILFELKDEDNISKDLLVLLLKVNTFGVNPVSGVSPEADAAKLVAQELCGQFSDCWVGTENGIEKSVFIACAENGVDCFIDTKKFDLTELIDNRLEWVNT